MQVAPEAIHVRKRVRRSLGDLEPLAESLKKYGQLHPILINRKYELIAGQRRLEAARLLGWAHIEAVVIDSVTEKESLELELEENVRRAALSEEELAEAHARLERLSRPGFWRRLLNRLARFFSGLFRRRG